MSKGLACACERLTRVSMSARKCYDRYELSGTEAVSLARAWKQSVGRHRSEGTKRLLYRPLTGTTETQSVGIARATKGDVTPAGEKFCEILRQISTEADRDKSKPTSKFVLGAQKSQHS